MFAFSDEGGGEGLDGLQEADLDHLVYAKIPDFDRTASTTANSSVRGSLLGG